MKKALKYFGIFVLFMAVVNIINSGNTETATTETATINPKYAETYTYSEAAITTEPHVFNFPWAGAYGLDYMQELSLPRDTAGVTAAIDVKHLSDYNVIWGRVRFFSDRFTLTYEDEYGRYDDIVYKKVDDNHVLNSGIVMKIVTLSEYGMQLSYNMHGFGIDEEVTTIFSFE